ncbi:MAG: ROK family protein [Acidimicrobiia bacterium]|nr:ROK family protein [Acidimicrobiia bacterium]
MTWPGSVIGVDVGGSKILARIVDPETGAARGRVKKNTPTDGPLSVIDCIVNTVEGLAGWQEAAAIGVGVPGPVTPDGTAGPCPNIVGWDEPVQLAAALADRFDKPVVVSNDVNCGAIAEHRIGSGRGHADMLAIFVGTGVGGGLILDNKLVVGERGMVGEIGHLTVDPGGRPCGCGGFGHLETYAGRAGIDNEMRRRTKGDANRYLLSLVGDSQLKSRHIAAGLEAGDELSAQLIDEAADALARVIGNAATLLDLPLVVLGGGIVDRLGEPFLDQIRASDHFGGAGADFTELVLARRLDDAGAVGAAFLVVDPI